MDDLAADRVGARLHTGRYGRSLEVLASTGSTNDDARRAAEEGAADGHVVVADAQTAGRGAHGRRWSSPGGCDLYFSIVARPGLAPAGLPPITLATGLALAEVAEATTGRVARVKWPNDVWLDGRKTAGVLVETSTAGARAEAVIIGVGLNVNRREWPPDLIGGATSLAQARGEPLDRAEVLAQVLVAIERWVDRLVERGPAPVVDALDERLALRGERVRIDGEEGVLVGVSRTGAVRLRGADGHVRDVLAGTLTRAQ